MNPLLIVGALGAIGIVAVAATSKPKTADSMRPDKYVHGWPGGLDKRNEMVKLTQSNHADKAMLLWNHAQQTFYERRKMLPKDAYGTQDSYTKEKYILPSVLPNGQPSFGSVDEFGRPPAGLPQNFGATLLQVTAQVAPLIPGIGTAAGTALAYAIAIGQGKSQRDALIAAARAALPVQYRLAFDLGVGIASGQSVTEAAKQALFAKYPGSKQAYAKGKSLVTAVKVFNL